MIELPDEIICHILEYNADFHPNLMKCHKEMEKYRPQYYKRVVKGFCPGIGADRMWRNFSARNREIILHLFPPHTSIRERIGSGDIYKVVHKLKLYGIEITPEEEMSELSSLISSRVGYRNIVLYYGWDRNMEKTVREEKCLINCYMREGKFKPGYY